MAASSDLTRMYQEVLLDHAKHPHGRGLAPSPRGVRSGESHQVNPTCGDEITLRVALAAVPATEAEPHPADVVTQVSWEGQGCSISQAAASVLADLVTGRTTVEVARLDQLFRALMASRGRGLPDEEADELGDATAFSGVSQYPARIKCALLAWMALKDALVQASVPVKEEP